VGVDSIRDKMLNRLLSDGSQSRVREIGNGKNYLGTEDP